MDNATLLSNKPSIVKQIPLFSQLNWFDLNFVIPKVQLREYKKGDGIYQEGDPPDAFYCLISGRLEASTNLPDNKKEVLEYLYRGEYFGIISLLTGEPHSVTIRAVNDSVVLYITKDDFSLILKRIPRLAVDLGQSASRRFKRRDLHEKTIFKSTIISVYGPTGRSGSSTYAINLALSLKKETGKKVVFLNTNTSAENVLTMLGIASDLPALDLKHVTYEHTKITKTISSHEWGIDLLNITYNPAEYTQAAQVNVLLSFLSNDYHFIVVDLPDREDDIITQALTQSDVVHIMALPQEESLKKVEACVARLKERLQQNFRPEKVRILMRQALSEHDTQDKSLSHGVYATVPPLKLGEGQEGTAPDDITVVISKPQSDYARAVRRIAREVGGVLVGLALGGGGALGLIHIGVIKVLEQENIPIDVIVGSSMGALLGALWASGRSAREVEEIALQFKNKAYASKLFDFALPISGVIRGKNIDRFLRRIFGAKTFREVTRTLKIISFDLNSRQDIVFDTGSLAEAVRASCAIPGVLRPVQRGDMMLIDGGILNPVPTDVLVKMGIKKIIAVNALPTPDEAFRSYKEFEGRFGKEGKVAFRRSPVRYLGFQVKKLVRRVFFPNIFDIIVDSFQAAGGILAQESCRQADIVIHPELIGIKWLGLEQVEELIQYGEQQTRSFLPQIKNLLIE